MESKAITKKSASNLALAFILLPQERRDAMSVLYAFCRAVDDIADEETVPLSDRRAELEKWGVEINLIFQGSNPSIPLLQEFQPVIKKYGLSQVHILDLLRGVMMDLEQNRYPNMEELEVYCHRVASVVGLLSIEIFGYSNPACQKYAVELGKALQLTNILRDVRNDAERGRIYLPLDLLNEFKVREEEILKFQYSDRFFHLASHVAERARRFYSEAHATLPAADRRSMIAAELMGSVYWRLLNKLEKQRFDVFGPKPARLNKAHKIFLILRTWYRLSSGVAQPNYGTV